LAKIALALRQKAKKPEIKNFLNHNTGNVIETAGFKRQASEQLDKF
jgi:hypothetical protein